MKTTLKWLACITAINIALVSCHKETPSPTGTTTYASVTDFINRNGAVTQTFNVNITNNGTFTGARGTVFNFQPGTFVNSSGIVVTGNIDITLREIYSNADMILSNKTTVAYGNIPLQSGGEFFIQAAQNNQPLHVAPGMAYHVFMPADTLVQNMNVYTWTAGNTAANAVWVNQDTAGYVAPQDSFGSGYSLAIDSLNWINCDGVFPSSTYYQITANPVNCPNLSQTNMYVFVNGHHAVWQLLPGGNQFITPQDIVPGIPLTIVAISVSNGKVYSAFTPVTISGNQTVNMNFSLTTDALFNTAVEALH